MYFNYHFFGMDLIWWLVWAITLICFFSFFVPVPRKTAKKHIPLDILQHKLSSGEINIYEYEQKKRFLEKDEDLKTRLFFLSRSLKN